MENIQAHLEFGKEDITEGVKLQILSYYNKSRFILLNFVKVCITSQHDLA